MGYLCRRLIVAIAVVGPINAADLLVNMTPAPDPAIAGGNVTYSISVDNNGPEAATNVQLTDVLPAGVTFVSASASQGSCSGTSTVTCNLGTISFPGSVNVSIVVTPTVAGSLSNTASVAATEPDAQPSNNSITKTVTVVAGADLSFTASGSPSTVYSGQTVTYTINARNDGPQTPTSASVTITNSGTVGSFSGSGTGWSCSVSSGVMTCNRTGSRAVGAWNPLTVSVSPSTLGTLTSTINISSPTSDPDSSDNTGTINTTVDAGTDLNFSTFSDSPDPVSQGANITYTVTPRNSGPVAANNVVVTLNLPAAVGYVSASGAGWTCGNAAQTVTCTRPGPVGVGNMPTITLTASANTVGSATLTGSISMDEPDISSGNNSGSTSTNIQATGSDLRITKSVSPATPAVGNTLNYTIGVQNLGPTSLNATTDTVTVTDVLASNVTYAGFSGTNWSCLEAGGTVTCTYSSGPTVGLNGSLPTLTVQTTVASAGSVASTACVSTTPGLDGVAGNNCVSAGGTATSTNADLAITHSDSPDPVLAGAQLTYSINVTNNGPDPATSVSVSDSLANNYTFVSATPTQGTCAQSGNPITCSLGNLANGDSAQITIVVRPTTVTASRSNTVTVSSLTGDPNLANNSHQIFTQVNSAADLQVTATATPNPVLATTPLTYVANVRNNGPSNATTTQAIFTIPADFTVTSVTPSTGTCTTAGVTITCSLGTLNNGTQQTVTIVGRPGTVSASSIDASVSSAVADSNSANNTSTTNFTVDPPEIDLLVQNNDDTDPVAQGSDFTYTIRVTNNGPSIATGVQLSDTIPAAFTLVSVTPSQGSCTPGATVVCSIGTLNAGANATVQIRMTATSAGSFNNSATVSATENDSNSGNNTSVETTTSRLGADLRITNTPSTPSVRVSESVTFTLTVHNDGPGDSLVTSVTDSIPANFSVTSVTPSQGSCTGTASINCTLGRVNAGGQATITVVATAVTTGVVNTPATVTGSEPDPNSANNSATATVTINAVADLTVSKVGGPFSQGQIAATYTITVSNAGADATSGLVTLTDTVPAGLTPTGAAGTGWNCTVTGQDVSCSRSDTLAASSAYPPISVTVNVAPNAPASVNNTAMVTGGGDITPGNNSGSVNTSITQVPDLTLTKVASGPFSQGQSDATYLLTVSNGGGAATSSTVTVTDTLPAGLTLSSVSGEGWACTATTPQVADCSRGDSLATGAPFPAIRIVASIALTAPAQVTNTATVAGGGELYTGNNTAVLPTTVKRTPDLRISKTANGPFVHGQTDAAYSLAVDNVGFGATESLVTVVDTLPQGLTATAASGAGWTCTVAPQTVNCTRADELQGGQSYPVLTITVQVAIDAPAQLTNTAVVSGGGDPNPTNNTAAAVTPIGHISDVRLTKTAVGPFARGASQGSFHLTVQNVGSAATTGPVVVTDTLSAGLQASTVSGAGWACSTAQAVVTCSRNDALASGASYPAIVLHVAVAADAPGELTNTSTVSGGGELNTSNNAASALVHIEPSPDLLLTKTAATASFQRGEGTARYSLVVRNTGPAPSSGTVSVTDTLPAGVVSATATGDGWSCNVSGQNVSCSRADILAPGSSYSPIKISASVTANALSPVSNTAGVSGGGDVNLSNNSSTVSTPIVSASSVDLSTSIFENAVPTGGSPGKYLVTVANASGLSYTGEVTSTTAFPAGLQPTAATGDGWACQIGGQNVTCTRTGTLARGTHFPAITIVVQAVGPIHVSPIITHITAASDTNAGNNTAQVHIGGAPVTSPDLTLTKASPASFTEGSTGQYVISVQNLGTAPTTGPITVSDSIPAGLVATAAAGNGWNCQIAGQNVSCTMTNSIAPGAATSQINISVTISETAPDVVVNTASVTTAGDSNPANNTGTATTNVTAKPGTLPTLQLSIVPTTPLVRGQNATYSVSLANVSRVPTSNMISVEIEPPPAFSPESVTGEGWTCTVTPKPSAVCTRADSLAARGTFPPIILVGKIAKDAPEMIEHIARLRSEGLHPSSKISAVAQSPVLAPPDLSVTKTHEGIARQGTDITFLLNVRNDGTSASTGKVELTDSAPEGMTLRNATGDGWTCTTEGRKATCSRTDALAPNRSYPPVHVIAALDMEAASSLTNVATVTAVGDLNTENNTASDKLEVLPALRPDLTLSIFTDDEAEQGGTTTLRMETRNIGEAPTTGVSEVQLPLPEYLSAMAAEGDGWSCEIISNTVYCRRADVLAVSAIWPMISVTARVSPDAPASIELNGIVTSGNERNTENNRSKLALAIRQVPLPKLSITKTVDRPFAEIGDVLNYRIEIANLSEIAAIEEVVVVDRAPSELVLVNDSPRLEMGLQERSSITAVRSGDTLRFSIGGLLLSASAVLVYRMRVGAGAAEGELVNRASATGRALSSRTVNSQEAQAKVRIGKGVFPTTQFVIGRVFLDANGNGLFDRNEVGVAGARVFLSNGQSVTTDSRGLYNLPSLAEGSFTIAVDPMTLPANDGLTDGARNRWTRLLRTPLGSGAMLRQNFPVRPLPGAPVAQAPPEAAPRIPTAVIETTLVGPMSSAGINSTQPSAALQAARLEITSSKESMQAGGRETSIITVRAFDADGHPVNAQVALTVDNGQFLVERACTTCQPQTTSTPAVNSNVNRLSATQTGSIILPSNLNTGTISVPNGRTERQTAGMEFGQALGLNGDPINESAPSDIQHVMKLANGAGSAVLLAGYETGQAIVSASAGDAKVETRIEMTPEKRTPLLVALGELSFGRSAPEFELFRQGGNVHRRAELFFRESFGKKNLFTAAYSSARPLNRSQGDRLFQLDPLNRVYSIFGDSSTRHEYAQSNSKLYARLDHGRSHLMFGDLRTQNTRTNRPNDWGMSDASRNITGIKLHLENSSGAFFEARGARPDTAFAREVFMGNTFGMIRLANRDILQGSEIVTLEVRDRRNPDHLISRETLVRNTDYNIDALAGGIFLLRSVQTFDEVLNLTQLVVTYEHHTVGRASNFYTARAKTALGQSGVEVGGSFLAQRQETSNYQLASIQLATKLFNGGRLTIETVGNDGHLLMSGMNLDGERQTPAEQGGSINAELTQPVSLPGMRSAKLRTQLAKVTAGFENPFGALAIAGSQRAAVDVEWKPLGNASAKLSLLDERNKTSAVTNARKTASGSLKVALSERIDLLTGYDYRDFSDRRSTDDRQSHLITTGVDLRLTSKLMVGARREQNVGSQADPTYPSQTLLLGKYKLNEFSRLFFTQRLSNAPIQPIVDLSRSNFGAIQSKNETAFGVETRLKRLTSLTTRYQMENGISGTDSYAVIGLVNRVPVAETLSIDLGLERGFLVDGASGNFLSSSFGFTWAPTDSFRASTRYELRDRRGFGHIFTTGAAGRIRSGVTSLVSLQNFRTDFAGAGSSGLMTTGALAIRPLNSERTGVLFSLTHRKLEGAGGWRDIAPFERTTVLSTDGYWQPLRRLELFGRFATSNRYVAHREEDRISTLNLLWQGRGQVRMSRFLDAAFEGRMIQQPATSTFRTSAGTELGLWIIPDLRMAVGYSLRRTDAGRLFLINIPDRGWYFVISTKLSDIFDLLGTSRR